jgi:hypothetical protein
MRPRQYFPGDDELIYHYCGADTFHAICLNKKLRFSDLHSMNDYMERHWGYDIWEEAASGLLYSVGKPFLDEIDRVFHTSGIHGLLLASCFSRNGDVLSQWRAYAEDGAGYSIGFSAKELAELPVSLLEVLYDRKEQVKEMTSLIKALYEAEQSETKKFGSEFVQTCFMTGTDMAAYKNPAFSEEEEIRLVHLLDIAATKHSAKFVDGGGIMFGKTVKGEQVQFRMVKGIPSPFIDLDYSNKNRNNPIRRVVLGWGQTLRYPHIFPR